MRFQVSMCSVNNKKGFDFTVLKAELHRLVPCCCAQQAVKALWLGGPHSTAKALWVQGAWRPPHFSPNPQMFFL